MFDLKELMHSIDGGVIVLNEGLQIVCWNDWMKVSTGILADNAIGKGIDEVLQIEPIKLATLKRNIKTSLAMNIITFMIPQTHNYLFKVPLKNPFLTSFEFMQQEVKIITLDKEQNIIGIFITDHTAVMDSRQMLQKEKQKIEDILNAQNEILFLTDGFKIRLANKKFLDFLATHLLLNITINQNVLAIFLKM
jgi:hypothetical protein